MTRLAESNQRKQQIADALIALTEEKDYSKITVQDIARQAEINRQTFYYHFADKEQLLDWVYLHGSLKYLTSEDLSLDNWEEKARQMLEAMHARGNFYQKTVTDTPDILVREFSKVVTRLFHKLFEDVDAEGILSDQDKAFYGRFFAYGCSGVLVEWISKGLPETPLEIATQLFRLAKDVEFFSYRLYESDN